MHETIYGCPICGYEPGIRFHEPTGRYAIFCENPACSVPSSDWFDTLDEAICNWNDEICEGVDINAE